MYLTNDPSDPKFDPFYQQFVEESIKKQTNNKKMLELVEFINELLEINLCSEDIYTILSYMCRNNYFTNWEFKNNEIVIDNKQITKNGILIKKLGEFI